MQTQPENFKRIAILLAILLFAAETPLFAQKSDDAPWIRPNIPSKMPVDQNRVAAAGIEVTPGPNLTIYTDVRDRMDVAQLNQVFEQAVPQLFDYFQIDHQHSNDWRLSAIVMLDEEKFRQSGLIPDDLPTFPAGLQRGAEFWVYAQQGDYYTRHLFLHESVHAVMNHFLGGTGAAWYSEGMAELVGLNRWRDGRLELAFDVTHTNDVPFWGRVGLIQDQIADGETMTLDDVVDIDPMAFRQVRAYAWAWAACEFLSNHPLSAKVFTQLPQHCAKNPAEFNSWLRRQLKNEWPELCYQWRVFISEMDYGYDVKRAAFDTDQTRYDQKTKKITVKADQGWQLASSSVDVGVMITISAEGRFEIANDGQPWISEPNGITIEYYSGKPLGQLVGAIKPGFKTIKEANAAPLMSPESVGIDGKIKAPYAGKLYLRLNDSPSKRNDNRGHVMVRVAK